MTPHEHSTTCAYYQFMFNYSSSLSEEEAPECDCKEEEK